MVDEHAQVADELLFDGFNELPLWDKERIAYEHDQHVRQETHFGKGSSYNLNPNL